MNVVIYARYSSNSQRDASIEIQLEDCYKYCKDNGLTVVEEYIDKALTGRSDKRPKFMKMVKDSAKGHFQEVITYRFDRFSRDKTDNVIYKNALRKNGVKVVSVHEQITDDPTGAFIESIIEAYGAFYSAELAQKVTDGLEHNAKNFLSNGTKMLGYITGADKKYQIDPETAPIVKYIYEEYANGKTIVEITDYLNSKGYKTSTGGKFNKNSLRTILKNKRYIGYYIFRGVETPNVMPRIISDELFYKVADIMEKNRKAPARSKANVEYLLTTKLFCVRI